MTSYNLHTRRWLAWARDAAERAVKTIAQAVLAQFAITEGLALDAFYDAEVWSVAAAAGVISVLTSLASKRVGNPTTAALTND